MTRHIIHSLQNFQKRMCGKLQFAERGIHGEGSWGEIRRQSKGKMSGITSEMG